MKDRAVKSLAIFLSLNIFLEVLAPSVAFALTGGPSQPEVQGFQPIGVSDMVDVKTGDFSYNLPLMDVGGYPINLVYNAGASMDDEASWVGLGWSLNPGTINRSMKGLPDDFKGEGVQRKMNVKPDITTTAQISIPLSSATDKIEIFGIKLNLRSGLNGSLALSYNNYNGMDVQYSMGPSATFEKGGGDFTSSINMASSAKSGLDLNPSLGLGARIGKLNGEVQGLSTKWGLPFNSRQGLKQMTFQASVDTREVKKIGDGMTYSNISSSYSTGSPWVFNRPSISPKIEMPRTFSSVSGSFAYGSVGGIMYQEKFNVVATYSENRLSDRDVTRNAYGSLYSQYASSDDLMDFNREKDVPIGPNTPYAGMALAETDGFSASGQGISGQFKVYRKDFGTFYDPYLSNTSSSSFSAGLELGKPLVNPALTDWHVGINMALGSVTSAQGPWSHNYFGQTKFRSTGTLVPVGETVPLNSLDGIYEREFYSPHYFDIYKNGQDVSLNGYMSDNTGTNMSVLGKGDRVQNNAMSYLTAEEAVKYSHNPSIVSYSINTNSNPRNTSSSGLPRNEGTGTKRGYHLSELTVNRTDGARYIYGIPVYNNKQKEVTFSIGQNKEDDDEKVPNYHTGLVGYDANDDVDINKNNNGQEHFVESVETPGYAHSFLLTDIFSADYIDRSGDGPTTDDFGSYTKINYSKIHNEYKWRIPVEENKATHSEGFKSIPYSDNRSDDKASYIYGTKEIWLCHSIQTKTHTAFFVLEPRTDGLGVAGESGGVSSGMSQYRLSRIDLFTNAELTNNPTNPSPIKSVHFKYDYSLCNGILNSSAGKLTLKSVYFTYGNSNKGMFSPYKFTYSDNNPNYNIKAYNRWGGYKPNGSAEDYDVSGALTNAEFPYVVQDKTKEDKNVSAWNLVKIELPSGGEIKVDYESDDYAYVQDKKAMQMYVLNGASKESTSAVRDDLMLSQGLDFDNHSYFHFDLPEVITSQEELKKKLVNGVDNVYFKCLVNIAPKLPTRVEPVYEYITGYAKYKDCNVYAGGTKAWIRFENTGIKSNENGASINPITKATWNFIRMQRPELIYNMGAPNSTGLLDVFTLIGNLSQNVAETFLGINRSLRNKGIGFEFVPGKSFIRLNNLNGKKLGGGHRVKRIKISDKWDTMAGGAASEYGQEYDYTTTGSDNSSTISSGVASFEPSLGGEENPWRQPLFYSSNNILVPDDKYYMEEPFGEGLFPSPQVIYSKVKVTSINNNYKTSNTGYVVNEFYTTRDFPTITKKVTKMKPIINPRRLRALRFFRLKDYRTFSQAFVVELNSIAGQAKSTEVFDRNNNKISGAKYIYKTEKRTRAVRGKRNGQWITDYITATVLSNNVNVLRKNKVNNSYIGTSTLGMEIENYSDSREFTSDGTNIGFNLNLDPVVTPIGFFLGILPLFPLDEEKTRVRILTNVKVIYHNPILEKVVAYEDGAEVETENLLYDETTGEVLLTKTTNQFGDPVFNFTYPAHFAYDRMGHSYKNTGHRFTNVNFGVNSTSSSGKAAFVVGDELRVMSSSGGPIMRAWVVEINGPSMRVIDESNAELSGSYSGIILRSGRRNMQSVPMGSITTLSDPRVDSNEDGVLDNLNFAKVLNAGAVEFSENWRTYCECEIKDKDVNGIHPFLYGVKGNWRAIKNYAYLTERIQNIKNNNTDIRNDGVFKSFSPFWIPSATGNWSLQNQGWQFVTAVENYTPNGYEIENIDALGRYSSASYGYYNMLPVAVHNNSKYVESASEGFEDYYLNDDCIYGKKLSYLDHKSKITKEQSHTGRYSIKAPSKQSVNVLNETYCIE
jgi:hypothetical protein